MPQQKRCGFRYERTFYGRFSVSVKVGGSAGGTVGGVTTGQRQCLRSHRLGRSTTGHLMTSLFAVLADARRSV